MSKAVHVGCSGWNYRDWRGLFYPEKLAPRHWLEHYSRVFETVEVNATFYRLQKPEAVARWLEQTPDDFIFSVKASRYLTHIKRLRGMEQGLGRYLASIAPLVGSRKLGPILWQLPENFHRDDERLRGALAILPGELRHCFEFRHPSWFCDEVYDLLRARGAALVIGDDPRRPFQTHEMTADWTFLRFHRGHRGRRGNYSDSEIAEWAERIDGWRGRVEVFAYFNNDWEGFAPPNARRLRRLLEGD
jgi:uncharacterized protein YecE (DUF72 family)